ncbi:binding--dependent transport system inner membrane component family protein, partial [Vibrio parahaemolyticus VP2007-007]
VRWCYEASDDWTWVWPLSAV